MNQRASPTHSAPIRMRSALHAVEDVTEALASSPTSFRRALPPVLSSGPKTIPVSVELPLLCGAAETPGAASSAARKTVMSRKYAFHLFNLVWSLARPDWRTAPWI